VKAKLLLAGLSVLAFLVSLVGLLALQGRLDYEGTRGIPVLGSFFAAPPASDAATETRPSVEAQDSPDAPAVQSPAASGGDGQPAQSHAGQRAPRGALFEFPPLQSNLTPEEMTSALVSLEVRRRDLDRREAQIAREKEELSGLARDMEERRKAVRADMAMVQSASEEVDLRLKTFRGESSLLEQQEQKNYKEQADRFAVMDPQKAAELLLEMGPESEDKAAKLLSLMDAETAARVLGEMDPKRGARIVTRSLKLVREPARPPGR
jgi:flagellar motility protein MotE (MotC chaperone)